MGSSTERDASYLQQYQVLLDFGFDKMRNHHMAYSKDSCIEGPLLVPGSYLSHDFATQLLSSSLLLLFCMYQTLLNLLFPNVHKITTLVAIFF